MVARIKPIPAEWELRPRQLELLVLGKRGLIGVEHVFACLRQETRDGGFLRFGFSLLLVLLLILLLRPAIGVQTAVCLLLLIGQLRESGDAGDERQ